jgi:hypothetical protein
MFLAYFIYFFYVYLLFSLFSYCVFFLLGQSLVWDHAHVS